MNKLWGKYFIAIILTVSVIATLTGFITAQAQMQTPASQGWEAEWQKTLEAGRKEGTVSVYVSLLAPAVRKQAPVFKNQFGINVEVTTGRGTNLLQKLRTEKAAGMHLADVVISGTNALFVVKQLGLTGPMENKLILPEV
ncbi:MAG: hypothetical protein Q8P24_08900, partial [Desulfobacterales bacterium]|nr:hypothetical protein [Desulfobacterales bacterium]